MINRLKESYRLGRERKKLELESKRASPRGGKISISSHWERTEDSPLYQKVFGRSDELYQKARQIEPPTSLFGSLAFRLGYLVN